MTVLHQPRVALDGARVIAARCGTPAYPRFRGSLGPLLGPELTARLAETDRTLIDAWHRGPAEHERAVTIAAGVWRVRLQDLLRTHPDRAAPLAALFAGA